MKLMSTLQRWGVLGLGVLSGHGVTAKEERISPMTPSIS